MGHKSQTSVISHEQALLLEESFMAPRLEQALAPLASAPIRLSRFKAKAVMSRKTARAQRITISYQLDIVSEPLGERRYRIMAFMPVARDFQTGALLEACRRAEKLPCVRPFVRLAGYIEDLRMAFHFVPVDLRLPALAEMSGPGCGAILAPHLPECHEGAVVENVESELKHYKPSNRCVLRMRAALRGGCNGAMSMPVYVKLFAGSGGERCFRNLQLVWSVARASSALRVPQPLGFDPARRMLVMTEAPGGRDLTDWIRCLEANEPLPDGVSIERVRSCLSMVAQAMAELHRSHLAIDSARTFASELEQIEKDFDILRERNPELAAEAAEVLERLHALAPDEAGEPMVPSHGGFRHKQLIGDERTLSVIDWDGLTLANPALDAATFLRRLRQEPLRRPGEFPEMEALADHFRREFLKQEPDAACDLPHYEAMSITETALRSFRRKARNGRQIADIRNQLAAARSLIQA